LHHQPAHHADQSLQRRSTSPAKSVGYPSTPTRLGSVCATSTPRRRRIASYDVEQPPVRAAQCRDVRRPDQDAAPHLVITGGEIQCTSGDQHARDLISRCVDWASRWVGELHEQRTTAFQRPMLPSLPFGTSTHRMVRPYLRRWADAASDQQSLLR
jgi:hypothetical protein